MSDFSGKFTYGTAIRAAFEYLLGKYPEVFVIGQGLWSPWYVGNSMTDLDKKFGQKRVIDTPVSELACTGAAVGASLCGMRPIAVHPRIDFMLYAMDAIVNQAAKWSHMVGGQAHPAVTIRAIVNRGGEQGAQHSQALHSWFAHVPGLRVVMPATVADARDLLIAAVLSDDPVMYIDDRWLYDLADELPPVVELDLSREGPRCLAAGSDLTLVACSYSTRLALEARERLAARGVSCEVIDLRVLNPLHPAPIVESVRKTGRLLAIDGGWRTCGMAAEVLAAVAEQLPPTALRAAPARITLPDAPAPTSRVLEKAYYPNAETVVARALELLR
jgi:acetoin:2,6-dichlorophenolindophenol oxidoreductase subunit beta